VSAEPAISKTIEGGRLRLVAEGPWTAAHTAALTRLADEAPVSGERRGRAEIDLSGVDGLDTFGAWLVERLQRAYRESGYDVSLVKVPERYRGLIEEVSHTNRAAPAPPPPRNVIAVRLERIGRATVEIGEDLLDILAMLGAVMASLVRALLKPRTFRFTSMVHQLDRVGWQAIGIIVMITFLIGCIIAQQGIFHFRRFGAEDYVVDLVGVLILREIGVLIVAIMVAGRSGSSYTAELGSMKMREEIDALRTMGLDPTDILILPRVLALVIALPALTFIGSMAALFGGGLVAWLYGGMSPEIFIARLKDAVSINSFEVGMYKAPVMALIIGVVACAQGLKVKGSAESLGLQVTASVVKSIFLVIVLDGAFAIFFASIGK
jgi:phospholipid/cholesterol/gamma-HCH transport system permease protein